MRLPAADDAELAAAIRRYVTPGTGSLPRYLNLLHGNFLTLDEGERRRFLRRLGRSARQISDRELAALLDSEWRSRLTASWLAGLDRREQFRDRLGELLLASELCYAGQGYCLALARFGTQADASLLATYLDSFLPQLDKRYDQDWALGALLHRLHVDDEIDRLRRRNPESQMVHSHLDRHRSIAARSRSYVRTSPCGVSRAFSLAM